MKTAILKRFEGVGRQEAYLHVPATDSQNFFTHARVRVRGDDGVDLIDAWIAQARLARHDLSDATFNEILTDPGAEITWTVVESG